MNAINLAALKIASKKYLNLKNDIDKSEYWGTDKDFATTEITDFLSWLKANQPSDKFLSEKERCEVYRLKNSK